ncbi:MAG: hypothetical protein WKG07_28095 [Hymenobacter sp.]
MSRWLRALTERLPRRWLRTWAYAALYLLAAFVVNLALNYLRRLRARASVRAFQPDALGPGRVKRSLAWRCR